jgi:hypothetical protein
MSSLFTVPVESVLNHWLKFAADDVDDVVTA